MSTSAMNRAVQRGIRRGLYLSATGDTKHLRKMRKRIESTDYVAEAWTDVGAALRESMDSTSQTSYRYSLRPKQDRS